MYSQQSFLMNSGILNATIQECGFVGVGEKRKEERAESSTNIY